ncbi:MAG: reverse transcriptase domain-containing protein [Nanoarchaeota archaeon]
MYSQLCSYENLVLAYKKARKGKTLKPYVIEFDHKFKDNLLQLKIELLFHSYKPKPLHTFILRDPKTRKISKSHFRDRVVHHALCNVIAHLFEKEFIYDSFANRLGKGTLKAIQRFEYFQRKVSRNYTMIAFVLKADIKKYFDNVSHAVLLSIIRKKITDAKVLWLIKTILANHKTEKEGVGMPLGNLTSQFFANVFLNELDHFVKGKLRAKYYIRYVDDFTILHESPAVLNRYWKEIDLFLRNNLALELHPDKTRIIPFHKGTEFLGMKIFPHHKLLKGKNLRKFYRKLNCFYSDYDKGLVNYDTIYNSLEGWSAYANKANTYKLKKRVMQSIEEKFAGEISTKEINRLTRNERKRKRKKK